LIETLVVYFACPCLERWPRPRRSCTMWYDLGNDTDRPSRHSFAMISRLMRSCSDLQLGQVSPCTFRTCCSTEANPETAKLFCSCSVPLQRSSCHQSGVGWTGHNCRRSRLGRLRLALPPLFMLIAQVLLELLGVGIGFPCRDLVDLVGFQKPLFASYTQSPRIVVIEVWCNGCVAGDNFSRL
jgi:hypothetical protein